MKNKRRKKDQLFDSSYLKCLFKLQDEKKLKEEALKVEYVDSLKSKEEDDERVNRHNEHQFN